MGDNSGDMSRLHVSPVRSCVSSESVYGYIIFWITETNVALLQPTFISTTYGGFNSWKGVDGDRNSFDGTMTNDAASGANWWAVDIGDYYIVEQVIVYNINTNAGGQRFLYKLL